jgi:hypothetical protein
MVKSTSVKNKKETNPENHIDFPGHALSLKIGSWKAFFSNSQNKILIARALNQITCDGHLNIKGYLITDRRLYLVLRMELEHIDHALNLFYDALKKEIKQHLNWVESMERHWHFKKQPDPEELWKHLFIRHLLLDFDFIDAISYKKHPESYYLNPPYYNPRLLRLVKKVRKYDFCSAIDYSGACGPVFLHGLCDEACPEKYDEKLYEKSNVRHVESGNEKPLNI